LLLLRRFPTRPGNGRHRRAGRPAQECSSRTLRRVALQAAGLRRFLDSRWLGPLFARGLCHPLGNAASCSTLPWVPYGCTAIAVRSGSLGALVSTAGSLFLLQWAWRRLPRALGRIEGGGYLGLLTLFFRFIGPGQGATGLPEGLPDHS
jgi:hypothetical protein